MSVRRLDLPAVERVLEGPGASRALLDELESRGLRRVFVATGPSMGATPQFRRVIRQIEPRTACVSRAVTPHNPILEVVALIREARAADVDGIVAIGGGSAMDAGKFVALGLAAEVTDARELSQYAIEFAYPDVERVVALPRPPVPVIALPTTLSAAEWDGMGSWVDRSKVKRVMRHLELTPRTVVLDPELCAATPRALWATTGARAVDHAVEMVYARNRHPAMTSLALGALRLLADDLPRAVRDAGDSEAVLQCQRAAGMSIIGVHNVALGLSHAIGHQLGAHGVPHGVTSCVVLPHVMRFLAPATGAAQAEIAAALTAGRDRSAERAAEHVEALFDTLGVPRDIRAFDVPSERIPAIADATLGDVVTRECPVPLTANALIELLERIWAGPGDRSAAPA